jgi:ribosome biogenesis ATPase
MISRKSSGPKRVTRGLDRDIYLLVRRLEQNDQDEHQRLSVSIVYTEIVRSNSSLARQKKRVLEESIERVLAVRREERKADELLDSDDGLESHEATGDGTETGRSRARDDFILNRQLVKHWDFARASHSNVDPGRKDGSGDGAVAGTASDTAPVSAERLENGEPRRKKRKADGRVKDIDRSPPTGMSVHDMAGIDAVLDRLVVAVREPLESGRQFVNAPRSMNNSVLLHGPSGCGKSTLANAVAASLDVSYIPVLASSLVGGTSGDSEKNIRDVFEEALRKAPCLVFIDEVDTVFSRRDNAQKGMEGRMVAEMMAGMDKAASGSGDGRNVVILAATNRPESLDDAVRRRFRVEIEMAVPSQEARCQILKAQAQKLPLAEDVDFDKLGKATPGYVGADLQNLVNAAEEEMRTRTWQAALRSAGLMWDKPAPDWNEWRARDSYLELGLPVPPLDSISMSDFKAAIRKVQPAYKREGFSAIPDTTWADVGAMQDVRKRLTMSIIGPISRPEMFASVGITTAAGILLWGPPGCGKTLVAKAVANESKANFISIKGPELLNKYVGESERAVRQLFTRAKSSAPCILFFDEMDALAPKRDDGFSEASGRVVNTLLTELDGVEGRSGVYVIGATNRPDKIDPAMRRPGRLGTSIFVGLPTVQDRVDILCTIYRNRICRGKPLDTHVAQELEAIARNKRCERFSGADLSNLMDVAAHACIQRQWDDPTEEPVITAEDWEQALLDVKPSVQEDQANGINVLSSHA